MALYKNINRMKMKTVGAVGFIRLLLLIAGVEPNPGPPDVLMFRYQYLLIKVGTILLRKLFDAKVGNDLMLYLRTYRKAAKQLTALLGNDIITAEQKKLLPPLDNNPNTANFDITLLFCLLRNICGLKPHTDAVWKCPASSDSSVEAEITRLKEFRNFVVHKGTVYISESDFNQKWSELCQILHNLNTFCVVPNLPEIIDDARSKPLDDQLKQQHDTILKAWHEAESSFEKGVLDIKQTQSELLGGQSEIKQTQSELMGGQSKIKQTQSELMGGQSKIKQTQSELLGGQSKIKQTQSELMGGQSKIKQTQSELMSGQSKIKQIQSELMGGQSKIKQTQSELMGGQSKLKQTQSELMGGQSKIKQTQSELMGGQSKIKQTQSELMGGQSKIKQTQSELMGGQSKIKQTQSELMGGQSKIKQTQSELMGGQSKIKQIQSELMDGQSKIKQTQSELMGGQSKIKQTQSELMGGQSKIKQTQSELMDGQSKIKQTQSELMGGQSKIKQTQSELMGGQSKIKQTQSELMGCQSKIKQTQSELMGGQSKIKQTQSELMGGQSKIKQIQSELMDGQSKIKQTQSELMGGQSKIKQTQSKLMGGQSKIKQTQSELMGGQSKIKQTQSELMGGQSKIKQTQSKLMGGQSRIKQTQSELRGGQSKIKQTQSELMGGQSKIKQTQSKLMGGQSKIKQIQSKLMDGQSKIKQTQSELMGGLSKIKQTQSKLLGGQSKIKQTQSELMGGQSKIKQTQSELMGGQSEIKQTQSDLMGGQSDIKQLQSVLISGQFEIKQTQSEMLKNVQDLQEQTKRRLDNSKQHDSSNKRIKSSSYEDIQQQLIKIYEKDICSGLPLFPLLEDETESILRLYELPKMYVVDYHRVKKQQTDKSPDIQVKTCSDLFHVKNKDCKNIYLTGDAGVGKTSFSKFLSLLWCKSKLRMTLENDHMQGYIEYLARFDFVFYVNLRDTDFTDLIAIIVDQLFYSENKDKSNKMYDRVEEILGNYHSLVIMDGLDEWIPKPTAKRKNDLPVRPISECVYLTTCRPYKIENIRLSETNLDHQVKMTGLGEKELESYVSNLIDIIKTKYDENKNKNDFMMAVKASNLLDLLHIPMITCHLVILWLDRPLTSMSQSLIYGNILDMLFKLALKKEIAIPLCKPSKSKFPDRLSELNHFKDHFSQVVQLCLLSFKLLFEHDTDKTSLVFTREQLASKPYCLSEVETDFCCTIGILSKNKVKRKFGKQEHKLSFLHKSYLEFFAAIYASTLEISDVLDHFHQCRTINDVLKYENFLIFYAGISIENFVLLITRIYPLISKDLDLTRVWSIFSIENYNMKDQLLFLQGLILKCYIDGYQLANAKKTQNALPLEDFIFDREHTTDTETIDGYQLANALPLEDFIFDREHTTDTETEILRDSILSNVNSIRLLRLDDGVYLDYFDKITNLQMLDISNYSSDNRAFSSLMRQNKSSLQIISFEGKLCSPPDSLLKLSHLPLEDLYYLTSLSLKELKISHEDLQYLTKFLCNTSQLKHLILDHVKCTEHDKDNSDICGSFELVKCDKLVHLEIDDTNIACTNVNTSSLEHITLRPECKSIAKGYINIINSIQNALELKELVINGKNCLDEHSVQTLITNVQSLSKIETIGLESITIRDNVSFLLHPSVKKVWITLSVKMTAKWFRIFLQNVINKHCCTELTFPLNICRLVNGDTKRNISEEESLYIIHNYITSISAEKHVKINKIGMDKYKILQFLINDNQ